MLWNLIIIISYIAASKKYYRDQETTDKGRRVKRAKRFDNRRKDRDISPTA